MGFKITRFGVDAISTFHGIVRRKKPPLNNKQQWKWKIKLIEKQSPFSQALIEQANQLSKTQRALVFGYK